MSTNSAVARNALLSLSYRQRQGELDQDYPSVLTLLSYSPVGMEEGFESIESLRREKVRLRLWIDEPLLDIYSITELIRHTGVDDILCPGPRFLEGLTSAFLFIPVFSYSLVSKVVQYDDCHPFSRTIMENLLKGRQVAGLSIASDPYHPQWKEKGWDHAAPLLKHDMKSKLLQLRGYGVKLLEQGQVSDWIKREQGQSARKRLLSQDEILQAYSGQKTVIRMEPSTIVTPLARDLAQQYGIKLTTEAADKHR